MSYTDTLNKNADTAGRRCQQILRAYLEGKIDYVEAIKHLTASLVVMCDQVTSTADLALAAELSLLRNRVVNPVGLVTDLDEHAAVYEPLVIEAVDDEEPEEAVYTLGRALTLGAAQAAYQHGMKRQGVRFWVRVPNAAACPVCTDLAEGVVPADVDMWTHKGCGCTQKPIG